MSVRDYDLAESRQQNAELVFGLIAPIGTDATRVADTLISLLRDFGTESAVLRLSDFIEPLCDVFGLNVDLKAEPEYERIRTRIDASNRLYQAFNNIADEEDVNSLLALFAAERILANRQEKAPDGALLDHATVLLTLKRPEEVNHLRRIYGAGLHVIGVFATEEERIKHLTRKKHIEDESAAKLVKDDADDRISGGQRTEEAFHLADVFLDVGGEQDRWKTQLGRYLDLLFSHPYHTPTRDEQAMFMAHAASVRSAQLGRQVGASITSHDGDVIALGCNEVPKVGGGQYWEDDTTDERDHMKGRDSNDFRKSAMLSEILLALPENIRGNEEVEAALRKTSLFQITEFGRAVHAEMEAILSCARKGISPVGKTLYTTTFPCHNCARHIVGAGIVRVVYVEPYPKSKAKELHNDAIHLGEADRNDPGMEKHVNFVPFVGISPRKYLDMFTAKPVYSTEVSRKLSDGRAINWQRGRSPLRIKMASLSYIDRELRATHRLSGILIKTGESKAEQKLQETSDEGRVNRTPSGDAETKLKRG